MCLSTAQAETIAVKPPHAVDTKIVNRHASLAINAHKGVPCSSTGRVVKIPDQPACGGQAASPTADIGR